jgi:YVTN family beta-propeller protein
MSKIRNKCISSILLILVILMSVIILPQLIMAQTLESILEQRNKFKMNPQIKLSGGLPDSAVSLCGIPAVNPTTNKIYSGNCGAHTVFVIDGNSGNVTNNILVGINPSGIAVNPTTNKIYVGNYNNNSVSIINGFTDIKERDIPVGGRPTNIAVNPFIDYIYVGIYENSTISVIDGLNNYMELTRIPLGGSLTDIAVNPNTDKVYASNEAFGVVNVINGTDITKLGHIYVGGNPTDIAVGSSRNKIYVANSDNNTVSVMNGITGKKESNDIPVGEHPKEIAFNPNTRMYYVMNSHTISVINGFNDRIAAGVTFNISPGNSGNIVCNTKEYPINTYLYIDSGIKCSAIPNKDFEFSSWVENLSHNSTITLNTSSISDSPMNSFLRLLNIKPNDTSAAFVIDRYGSFTANFKHSPPAIPTEYWIPLYGVIVSSIVGWSIPSIIGWIKGRRQRRSANRYYQKINCLYDDGKLDENGIKSLDRLKTDLTYVYARGKISQQHYTDLKSEVSVLYEEIYKKKLDSLSRNTILLDKIKDDIEDVYAKGKLTEQHYKLLNEKILDIKESIPTV